MRKFIIFIGILLFYQYALSQDERLDSLKIAVENYTKRDTIRVKNLHLYTRYTAVNNDKKSKTVLKEALEISKELNYIQGIADSYSLFSQYYVRSGNFKKALLYAEKAKKIQDSIKDIDGLTITNTSIANVYTALNEPEKAIKIHLENLSLLDNNDPKKAAAHFYLASTYQEISDYDNAIKHYNKAKKIAIKTNFLTGVAIANSAIGILEIKKGNYIKGKYLLEQALVFFKKSKQDANIAHSYFELANCYSKLKNIEKAIIYNNKAIEIYKKQGTINTLKNAYLAQSNYYASLNEFKKSNFYLKEHYKIKDSIFSKENVKIIKEINTKFETEKVNLEKKIAVEKSIKDENRLIFTILITGLLLLLGLFWFSRYKTKKKNEAIHIELKETQKRLALEKQYRSSELKALKAQMDPHFIFNALNSIQEYIVLNEKKLASDYLGKFADLMRKYLHFSDKGSITLQEEINTLNIYLELEKTRFEDTLNYKINIEKELDTSLNIPTMLVQPYVENALKHGLLHIKNNRKLMISFSKTDNNNIQCVIEDNGIGREKSNKIQQKRATLHKSFATKATQERLTLLNFGKEKKIGVKIIDLYNKNKEAIGTKVILIIPII